MQVYQDLRILSARPSADEEAQAPHLLYGFVSAAREFNTGDWLREAAKALERAKSENRPAVFTGGTGLYFKALTEGLVQAPAAPPEVREHWRIEHGRGADIYAELGRRDPETAARLAPADSPRILRALEVHAATGRTLSDWKRQQPPPLLAAGTWSGLFVNPDRAALYSRINSRFEAMLAAGALEEVRALMALGLPENRGIMKAHGVPHLVRHLKGELSLGEATKLGQRDTRNYARRQMTWARKSMADWRRVEPDGRGAASLPEEASPPL